MFSEEISLDHITSTATVYANDFEIPTNLANELRYAALSPDLRTSFMTKYKWSNSTIELIDWQIHSKSIQRQKPCTRKTIIQYIHRWLPTHGHPGTKDDITTKCPCCHVLDETNDHFLSCTNTHVVNEWNTKLETFYQEMKKLEMDPILLYYMMLALNNWRTTKSPDRPKFCKRQYKKLFKEQTLIGWNQVIMGRLSKSWVDIQNDYHLNTTTNGISIISTAITKVLTMIHQIWTVRCDMKYRSIDTNPYRINILLPKVNEIYNNSQSINTLDRSYFDIPIETILDYNTPRLQHWIRKTETYLKQAIARTTAQIQQLPPITRFFPRRKNPQKQQRPFPISIDPDSIRITNTTNNNPSPLFPPPTMADIENIARQRPPRKPNSPAIFDLLSYRPP